MPSFLERTRSAWNQFFIKQEPVTNPVGPISSDDADMFVQSVYREWGMNFVPNLERQRRLEDLDTMDTGDMAVALDATVDAALMFEEEESSEDPLQYPESFKIVFDQKYGSARAKSEIARLLYDTNLRAELPVYARDALKYGDALMEIVPDAKDDTTVRRIIHKLLPEMRVVRDGKGRLEQGTDKDGNPIAYQQLDKSGRTIAGWYPDEMVHFKLYPDSALTYSQKGMLDDVIGDWKKLNYIEQGMVIARCVRAYPRLLHRLDMTGKTDKDARKVLDEYVRNTTMKAQANASNGTLKKTMLEVDEDYFLTTGHLTDSDGRLVTKQNSIELLDPSVSGLGNIEDVKYSRRRVHSKVPAEVVGIEDQLPQDMTAQDIAYGRFVRRLQRRLEDGIRQLINHQLDLKGIGPVQYRIIWPEVLVATNWKFADARFRTSMAERNDLEMGVTSVEEIMRSRGYSDGKIQQILGEWFDQQKRLTEIEIQKAELNLAIQNAAKVALAQQMPEPETSTTTTGSDGKKTTRVNKPTKITKKAGNDNGRRQATVTIPTKQGQGQAAQGAKGG